MTQFVALLRGVNVGKAKRVAMADFRLILEGLGFEGVVTLQNSGNAVFRADKGTSTQHAVSLAEAMLRELNIDVPVIVKSAKELSTAILENPIEVDADGHAKLLVVFAHERKDLSCLSSIKALVAAPEQFAIGKNSAYLYCPNGILNSKAGAAILGKIGKGVTTRNLATVLKLEQLLSRV